VLVMPKVAVSALFSYFIDKKRIMQELDCIVINKCYVLIELLEK
jgi:hypothetical protein